MILSTIISGVFLAGLAWIGRPRPAMDPERWLDKNEQTRFQHAQIQWRSEGWMLYR